MMAMITFTSEVRHQIERTLQNVADYITELESFLQWMEYEFQRLREQVWEVYQKEDDLTQHIDANAEHFHRYGVLYITKFYAILLRGLLAVQADIPLDTVSTLYKTQLVEKLVKDVRTIILLCMHTAASSHKHVHNRDSEVCIPMTKLEEEQYNDLTEALYKTRNEIDNLILHSMRADDTNFESYSDLDLDLDPDSPHVTKLSRSVGQLSLSVESNLNQSAEHSPNKKIKKEEPTVPARFNPLILDKGRRLVLCNSNHMPPSRMIAKLFHLILETLQDELSDRICASSFHAKFLEGIEARYPHAIPRDEFLHTQRVVTYYKDQNAVLELYLSNMLEIVEKEEKHLEKVFSRDCLCQQIFHMNVV